MLQRITIIALEVYFAGLAFFIILGFVRLFGSRNFVFRDCWRLWRTALAWPFMLVSASRRKRLMGAIEGGLK